MKLRNAIVFSALLLTGTTAFAGEFPAQQYLIEHTLIAEPIDGTEIVDRRAVEALDPTTAYLVESGLVEQPKVEQPAEAASVAGESGFDRDEVQEVLVEWGYI